MAGCFFVAAVAVVVHSNARRADTRFDGVEHLHSGAAAAAASTAATPQGRCTNSPWQTAVVAAVAVVVRSNAHRSTRRHRIRKG